MTARAISEQSGWCPTVATGPPASWTALAERVDRRARREERLDANLGARLLGDELGRLPRAHERAREHDARRIGRGGELPPERPCLVDALRRQLAKLVGLALGGRGVAAEVDDSHRRRA